MTVGVGSGKKAVCSLPVTDKTLLLTVAFHYLQSHHRNNMPRTPATKSSKASKEGPTHPSYEKVSNQPSALSFVSVDGWKLHLSLPYNTISSLWHVRL